MMQKLKGVLEVAFVATMAALPVIGTIGGAVAGVMLLGGVGPVLAGAYFGFVAGYTALSQAPLRALAGNGAPRGPVLKDVVKGAQLPFRGAAKLLSGLGISIRFNAAAGPKKQPPQPQVQPPKPGTPPQP